MNFWVLHSDFPRLPEPPQPRPEVSMCLVVPNSSQHPTSISLAVERPSRFLPWLRSTCVVAAFKPEEGKWRAASGGVQTNTSCGHVLDQDELVKLDENLPLLMQYSVGKKTTESVSRLKLGELLDDHPQLLPPDRRRSKALAAMHCVVRARFMMFPSTLHLVVRRARTCPIFSRTTEEKTIVKFSFNIDKWVKVPKSIHTFENSSFKEFVNYRKVCRLDSRLPFLMVITTGGRVTQEETGHQLADLLAYMLLHRRG